jgi:hypothetical protein
LRERVGQSDRYWLVGAAGVMAAGLVGTGSADAAVILQSVNADVPPNYSVSLGGDAGIEFNIIKFDTVTKVGDFAGAGVALDGSVAANLSVGTLVGPGTHTYGTPPTDRLNGPPNDGKFDPETPGENGLGFIGVQFTLGGNTHYGFVGYQGTGTNASATGHVRVIGWEDAPNTGIFTQEVPEPTSLALLAAGAAGLATYRGRRRA